MKETDYEEFQGNGFKDNDDDGMYESLFNNIKDVNVPENPDDLKELSYYVNQVRDPGAGKVQKKDMKEILKAFDAIEEVKQRVGKEKITNAERYELIELYENALKVINKYRSDTPKTELKGNKLRDFEKAQLMLRGELLALYESGRDNLPTVFQLWLRGANNAEDAIREHGFEYEQPIFLIINSKYEDDRLVAMSDLDRKISEKRSAFRVNEKLADYREKQQALQNAQKKEPEKEEKKAEVKEEKKEEPKEEKKVEVKEEKKEEPKEEKIIEPKEEKKEEPKDEKIVEQKEEKKADIKEEKKEEPKEEKKEENKAEEEKVEGAKIEDDDSWPGLKDENVDNIGFGEKAPKENLRDIYEVNIFDGVRWTAGTVLYGMLKDVLTKDEQDAIYKKMSFISLAGGQESEAFQSLYGEEYAEIAEALYDQSVKIKDTEKPKRNDLVPSQYRKYDDPRMEKPIALYKEGVKDLLDAINKKISTKRFDTPEEQNVFYLFKGFVEDMYDGTFNEKYLNDPQYEFAHNILTKVVLTAPMATIQQNDKEYAVISTFRHNIDDSRNIKVLAKLGIPDAVAGAAKTARMTDEHINTGDTTRDDLLNEYAQQLMRAQKYCSITEESFNAIQDEYKVFDNVYNEFSQYGNRGFGYIINDLNAKIDFIKAGYPVSDLPALSSFIRVLSGYELQKHKEQERLQELKAKENPDQNAIDKSKDIINEYDAKITQYKDLWQKMAAGPVKEADRIKNLTALKDMMETEKASTHVQVALYRLNERLNAPVNVVDKALLTDNVMTMYKLLDKADPMLMKSSKEFSRMKSALKTLADWQALMDMSDDEDRSYYKKFHKAAIKSVHDYLKYKTAQMNDPRKPHKRSQAEARRVKLADAIFNSLRSQRYPGEKNPISEIDYTAVNMVPAEKRFMKPAASDKLPEGYDSYIQKHMGRGIINADKAVLVDSLSKVMAAYMLKNEKEPKPFDVGNIRRCASELNKKFKLSGFGEKDLCKWLETPEKLKEAVRDVNRMAFGVNMGHPYDTYRKKMQRLYRVLPEPGNNSKYKTFFETVKKAAHLPKNTDDIDITKLEDQLAKINFEMVNSAKALIKGKEKTYSYNNYGIEKEPHVYAMHVLVDLGNIMNDVPGNVGEIIAQTNEKRGTVDTSYGGRFLERDDFGYHRYCNHDKLRNLDAKLSEEMKRSLGKMKNASENIKEVNKENIKQPKKEVDIRGNLKLDAPDKGKAPAQDAPVKGPKL